MTEATAEFRHRREARSWVRWRGLLPLYLGVAIVLFMVMCSILAPVIAPHDPTAQDLLNPLAPLGTPSHLLGTDQFGRDVLSRLLYAGRIDLLIALGATAVTLTFGTLFGLISGYYGGRVDAIMMRVVDLVFAFPFIVLVLAVIAILGPGLRNMFIAIWLVGWVPYARLIRGEVLVAKRQEYVLAARALDYRGPRIMLRHILPNVLTPALVYAVLNAVDNVGIGAALGFLGLGVQDPDAEWGKMIADGQTFLTTHWWLPTLPGIAIAIFGLGLSLIGDNLADRLRARS